MLTGGGEGVLGRGTPLHAPHEPPTHPLGTALNQTKLAQVAQVAQGQVEKAAGQGGQVRHQQMVEFL